MEITILIINLIILGGGIYFKTYLSEKAKNLATREEYDELSKQLKINTRATEEIKQTTQRKQTAKSKGSELIIEKMAEIETHLISWSVLLYFRPDELEPNESIEELGRRDLRKVAAHILELNKLISQYTIYFSTDLMASISDWSQDIYGQVYDYEAIYNASLDYHQDRDVEDRDKVKWISSLIEKEIYSKNVKFKEKKYQINQRLIRELELVNNGMQ